MGNLGLSCKHVSGLSGGESIAEANLDLSNFILTQSVRVYVGWVSAREINQNSIVFTFANLNIVTATSTV